MTVLCKTTDELKEVLKKLEKDGYRWRSGDYPVSWGMLHCIPPVVITFEKNNEGNKILTRSNYCIPDFTAEQFLAEGEATGERLINKAEFDKAISQATIEALEDPDLQGGANLMAALLGVSFAKKMKIILFEEGNE